MKKSFILFAVIIVFIISLIPQESSALGFEVAAGYWRQNPSGETGYKADNSDDVLDIEDDLNYESEDRIFGRLKAELPLFLPNIYLMATPMKFEGEGVKSVDFTFGDVTFQGGADIDSKLKLDHYDIALYYNLPFVKTATMEKLNAEIGLNVRIMDFEAEVEGTEAITGFSVSESASATFVVPMVYVGVQVNPVKYLSLEAEGRGIAYNSNYYYDFIGRLKIKPFGPIFIAGGYRHENIEIDEQDIEATFTFSGPFLEAGVQF